jgi:hypothetical protein
MKGMTASHRVFMAVVPPLWHALPLSVRDQPITEADASAIYLALTGASS